ncbi:hypothetical protein Bca52824_063936 [Brassica carinata]|uniref:Wall-associated receptor kinase galacturonan-binding domain-containing protein n=1 Tax=Brassica carinata TaxID=52824 RepID=A0A8X7QFC2_BRACI|nr:hypothetical protein Bca52824_063936 [Brassica carinata]
MADCASTFSCGSLDFRFPFFNTTMPSRCGLFKLNCTNHQISEIQLVEKGYDSPWLNLTTLYKCNNSRRKNGFTYANCKEGGSSLYYSDLQDNSGCSAIKTPVSWVNSRNKNEFNLNATFSLHINLPRVCRACRRREGECTMVKEKFRCRGGSKEDYQGDELKLGLGVSAGLTVMIIIAIIVIVIIDHRPIPQVAAAEDLLELHLCRLCRLLLRWIISRSGDQNRHRRSRSACKKKRKRDEEDAYYVPFPPPPGPKAGGPYGGQQQQWRQQNATPPSVHVLTSLPPPHIISRSILIVSRFLIFQSCSVAYRNLRQWLEEEMCFFSLSSSDIWTFHTMSIQRDEESKPVETQVHVLLSLLYLSFTTLEFPDDRPVRQESSDCLG